MKQLPILIFAFLLAVASAGGYAFMLISIQAAVDDIALARADSQTAEEQDKLVQTANVFIADTASVRSELSTYVTTDAGFVSAIEMMESAGKREKVDVTIGSVSVKKIDAKSHELAAVILSGKGSFGNVAAFASALESLPLASRVVSVALESSASNTWFGTFSLEFVKRKSP